MILGVNAAIFQEGRVLLTKRDDFHIWCLPGGHVDPGETIAQAAIREVREETGLVVRLVRLVGLYSRAGWRDGYHMTVFVAEITGGTLQPDPDEVAEIAWFHPDHLPEDLLLGHRQRVLDAASGAGGSIVRDEAITYPPDLPEARQELYARCAASGLPKAEFYARHFRPQDRPGRIEVEPYD
jgi:8-oxo-dGTP pyrophosphatase MutT (NUDIX family)